MHLHGLLVRIFFFQLFLTLSYLHSHLTASRITGSLGVQEGHKHKKGPKNLSREAEYMNRPTKASHFLPFTSYQHP
jgi:hypothetical protein